MKVSLIKQGRFLVAGDEDAEGYLSRVPNGQSMMADIKRIRNVRHHRLYWALVSLVFDNLPEEAAARYPDKQALHAAMKVASGVYTLLKMPDGREGYIPGSISFDKMDQGAFDKFFANACNAIIKYFLPGVTEATLREQVELMVGV